MHLVVIMLMIMLGVTTASAWEADTHVSPVDDRVTLSITQKSLSALSGIRKDVHPQLVISCGDYETSIYVHYGFSLADSEAVIIRRDRDEAERIQWNASYSRRSVGEWDDARAVSLIRSLFDKNRLFVRIHYAREPVDAVFPLEGLEEAVGEISRSCAWRTLDSPHAYVHTAQDGLNALGYDAGTPDDTEGYPTPASVLAFQTNMGLLPTARLDHVTLEVLSGEMLSSGNNELTSILDKLRQQAPHLLPPDQEQNMEYPEELANSVLASLPVVSADPSPEKEHVARKSLHIAVAPMRRVKELEGVILDQVATCWRIDGGIQEARTIRVPIRLHLALDGRVVGEPVIQEPSRYASDAYYRVAADAAVRAVLRCSPLQLPQQDYDIWKDMVIDFEPQDMVGG